jgi:hypothetical protein
MSERLILPAYLIHGFTFAPTATDRIPLRGYGFNTLIYELSNQVFEKLKFYILSPGLKSPDYQ